MVLRIPVLLCLLAASVCTAGYQGPYPIKLVIYNSNITNQKNLTYSTNIAYRGILLGALRTLENNGKLNFTVTEDPNYGPFLKSVNGVEGNSADQTYWEILSQLQNGTIIRPDVGVGCFIPNPNDTVILKFTTWKKKDVTTV